MDAVAITIGISWTLTGLVLILLSIPLARGDVGRNGFYGMRFPQSYQSDEAWFAINRFGGRRFILWAILLIALGIISFFLPLRPRPGLTIVLGCAPFAFVAIPAVQIWRFARNLVVVRTSSPAKQNKDNAKEN